MPARIDLDGLVNGVVTKLESRLNKPGIFILASPGCSRGLWLMWSTPTVGLGVRLVMTLGVGLMSSAALRSLLVGWVVLRGRVAVVVRNTIDAVGLRIRLGNAEVIYLPKYYEDTAKEVLSRDIPEVAKVRREGLGKGVSLNMLRKGVSSEVVESISQTKPSRA